MGWGLGGSGVWGKVGKDWSPPRHRGDPTRLVVSFPVGHGAEREGKGDREEKGREKRHGESWGRKTAGREMRRGGKEERKEKEGLRGERGG